MQYLILPILFFGAILAAHSNDEGCHFDENGNFKKVYESIKKKDIQKQEQSLKRIYDVTGYHPEKLEDIYGTHPITIIDDGFEITHPAFSGCSFRSSYNVLTRESTVDTILENNTHGTSVAGIVHSLAPSSPINLISIGKCKNGDAKDIEDRLVKALTKITQDTSPSIINLSHSLSLPPDYLTKKMPEKVTMLLQNIIDIEDKLIIIAVGNRLTPFSESSYLQQLATIANNANNRLILVGATCPQKGGEVRFDLSDQEWPFGNSYPDNQEYQSSFILAPSDHYTPYCSLLSYDEIPAFIGQKIQPFYKTFSMTSSAAPVVSALAARWWDLYPDKTASQVGEMIKISANPQGVEDYDPRHCGLGMFKFPTTPENEFNK